MQTRDGITYMTVPETEIDIERFTHVHSEGSLVFGKYRGVDTVVDRRKQVFCHFATCRTFLCYGNDDYAYRRWGCVEKEEQYEFYDYRINGQVSKKHTFTKGTCFKVLHLGFSIQIYAQFPTYGYLGSEMCNTIKTSDKNEEATGYVGYKLNRDPEINTDKFKLTVIANDTVFGIYNNAHVCIDPRKTVFCISAIDFVEIPDEEIDIEEFKLINKNPSSSRVDGIYKGQLVYIDKRRQVFCHFGKCRTISTNQTDIPKDEWIFVNNSFTNTLHDFVLFTQNVVSKSCKAEFEEGDVFKFRDGDSGLDIRAQMNGIDYHGTELKNKLQSKKEKPVTKEQTNSPSFTLSDMLTQSNIGDVVGVYGPNETTVFVKATVACASYICDAKGNKWVLSNRNLKPVNRNEVTLKPEERVLSKEEAIQAGEEMFTMLRAAMETNKEIEGSVRGLMVRNSLIKRICKQVGLEYPDVPTETFIRKAFDLLPDIHVYPAPSHFTEEADITFVNGDKYSIFSSPKTGMIYKEFTPAKQETKPTEQTANKMSTAAKQDYFKAALKTDEQFSIDSNAKYSKFDYEKGLLLNSKLIKDETFKEYNEPVELFSINLFDKLTTYVPVISPAWYKDFARAGFFCNTDDVNSFVNMDANGNPWFIVETPKVVKPIEKEPVVISHVLNTVDDLCNNTIPAKFCLITDTKQVYQMLSELEYKQYRQSQFAKGNPVVESIFDKADQIWVKISL